MSWFGPKLEPGERVAVQRPAPLTGRQWVFRQTLVAVGVAMTLAISLWLGSPNIAFFIMMYAAYVWIRILFELGDWRRCVLVITDRRLLAKRSGFWWAPEVIRLDEIESTRLDVATYFIVVRGGGQKIEVAPELIELDELERIIKQAKAVAL